MQQMPDERLEPWQEPTIILNIVLEMVFFFVFFLFYLLSIDWF